MELINYMYGYINKFSLNIDKTNIVLFNIRNINDNVKLKLKIDNKEIRKFEMIKFLGIIIDNKLDWNRQIHYICTKLSRSIASKGAFIGGKCCQCSCSWRKYDP